MRNPTLLEWRETVLTTSLFLCHNVDQNEPKETQMLDQLYIKLQDEGVKIADYPGSPAEEGFQTFLQEHLPACQWFILFQTPGIVALPEARQAVNVALKLVEQQQMEGIVRVIATPSTSQDVPQEWEDLPTYDATYDFERAAERVLLHISGEEERTAPTLFAPPLPVSAAFPESPFTTSAPPFTTSAPSLPSDFDRPPAPPSRLARLGRALHNSYQDTLYDRKRRVIVLSVLLLFTLLGSGLAFYFTRPAPVVPPKPKPVIQIPVYGQLYFYSTNMAIVVATTHIMDAVQVDLQHLKQPAKGNSYYAWLLPDVANENGSTLLLGQFTPEDDGSAHITYQSPVEKNLLGTESRFLITEESTSPLPDSPTADQSKWRYYGVFPQDPSPTASSHFSALDHLRHLLVSGPASMMDAHSPELSGGLAVWFLQNIHLIFELASSARGSNTLPSPAQIRGYCVQILDLLDGKDSVSQDVPDNTPWLFPGSMIASKPILTLDPNAMVPGYIHDIEAHLLGFAVSPGIQHSQQVLAGQADTDLNTVGQTLGQARDIAKQLVAMTDQQLAAPSVIAQLDALANASMDAYAGQLNLATGTRQGGVIAVFDHLQQLAQFSLYHYPLQK